jgi:hypothetical protein
MATQHEVFAFFQTRIQARGALTDLADNIRLTRCYSVMSYVDGVNNHSELTKHGGGRATRTLAKTGLILGVIEGGTLAGLAAGPLQMIDAPIPLAILVGAVVGTILIGVLGAIVGCHFPERGLQVLAARLKRGNVILDIRSEGQECHTEVARVLRYHGAELVNRSGY